MRWWPYPATKSSRLGPRLRSRRPSTLNKSQGGQNVSRTTTVPLKQNNYLCMFYFLWLLGPWLYGGHLSSVISCRTLLHYLDQVLGYCLVLFGVLLTAEPLQLISVPGGIFKDCIIRRILHGVAVIAHRAGPFASIPCYWKKILVRTSS